MSGWSDIFLAIIALATLTMAVLQLAVVIAAARAVKRMQSVIDRVERRLEPTFVRVDAIGEKLSNIAAIAARDAARVDVALDMLAREANRTGDRIRSVAAAPGRESAALAAGVRAAFDTFNRRLTDWRAAHDGA
jgi:hypothetical protein